MLYKIYYAVNNLGGLLTALPDTAILKIIELRLKKTLNKIQDRYKMNDEEVKDLGANLLLDLNVIVESLRQGRNLFEDNINVSNFVGQEDNKNIIGVLDTYQTELESLDKSIMLIDGFSNSPALNPNNGGFYSSLEYVVNLKEYVIQYASDLGLIGKTMWF